MDLYDAVYKNSVNEMNHLPLAVRMRPKTLDELAGQQHLLHSGSPLRQLVATHSNQHTLPSSVILYGLAGTGKTTIAHLIAKGSSREFLELSAVSSGVSQVRDALTRARAMLHQHQMETILFIDEIHRFSKAQQDALLPAVENREVILVAATTENPSFSIITPLLSRSLLLKLNPLEFDDIIMLLKRAIKDKRGLNNLVRVPAKTLNQLAKISLGDVRHALTLLEAAAGAVLQTSKSTNTDSNTSGKRTSKANSTSSSNLKSTNVQVKPVIDNTVLKNVLDVTLTNYDRSSDMHYDVVSAFIKSMRGSDVDAALHYLARMFVGGEDPRFIARRIMIAASEEIGMADPSALWTAVAAAQAVEKIGMPESQLILAQAVTHICLSPKSNAVTIAIGEAIADVQAGLGSQVPPHLRDAHYAGAKKLGHGLDYKYAHDFPSHIVQQQYLPDDLTTSNHGKHVQYYRPTNHGHETKTAVALEKIHQILYHPKHSDQPSSTSLV